MDGHLCFGVTSTVCRKTIQREQLHSWRELRLNTYIDNREMIARGPVWSAPNYLLLLSMAVQGFGWCSLPCALVEEFATEKPLVQLDVLAGQRQFLSICFGIKIATVRGWKLA